MVPSLRRILSVDPNVHKKFNKRSLPLVDFLGVPFFDEELAMIESAV